MGVYFCMFLFWTDVLFMNESCIKKKKVWILELEIWILFGFYSLSFGLSKRSLFVTKTIHLQTIVLVYFFLFCVLLNQDPFSGKIVPKFVSDT